MKINNVGKRHALPKMVHGERHKEEGEGYKTLSILNYFFFAFLNKNVLKIEQKIIENGKLFF